MQDHQFNWTMYAWDCSVFPLMQGLHLLFLSFFFSFPLLSSADPIIVSGGLLTTVAYVVLLPFKPLECQCEFMKRSACVCMCVDSRGDCFWKGFCTWKEKLYKSFCAYHFFPFKISQYKKSFLTVGLLCLFSPSFLPPLPPRRYSLGVLE